MSEGSDFSGRPFVQARDFSCPFCGICEAIPPGGYAFLRSRVLLHLAVCTALPDDTREVEWVADLIAESLPAS